GSEIQVPEARSVLEACREHGIHVPTLCYHPALEPYGACRLCMIELSSPSRPPRLVASCVHPCEEGAVIETDSAAVRKSRRTTIELLLAGAHNDAMLLALAEEYGVTEIRFTLPEEDLCVLCGLCVRACQEIVGVGAISLINRGMARKVSTPFQIASSTCIACGTCVLICPTDAIKLKDITHFHSVHGTDSEFDRVYCQVCDDVDLSPRAIQDVDALVGATIDQEVDLE
ncbi:MAG: (2Fe-2S)-binding protein, partial [Anaerolineales bacterium]|nr:(2Fe-2S)-binding protein [Anaerolineales bacterium]